MPGRTETWPWDEFSKSHKSVAEDGDLIDIKRAIAGEYGEETLRTAWLKVCSDLVAITDGIAASGIDSIPSFDARKIIESDFTGDEEEIIKRAGCFIIRQVLQRTEADQLYQDLEKYLADNEGNIKGWPAESPSMLMLYNSPTQITIRTHPNQLSIQRKLNSLWHDASGKSSPDPLLYSDGIRNRPPKQLFLGLGPHIDAGSLCRWADPMYRKYYQNIFSGKPDAHDCFDLRLRQDADQTLFPGDAHSTVFRSFQGWTALTRSAPGEGGLRLYPNLKSAIAYVLLRPFFSPPMEESLIMDPTKWNFCAEGDSFPGTFKDDSQRLSPSSHPHMRLKECLVHIPTIEPGDTVWWHADVSLIR